MAAKDKLKAAVLADIVKALPADMATRPELQTALEQPIDRIMAVVARRVDKAEKAAMVNKDEAVIQEQKVQQQDQTVRIRNKQLARSQRQAQFLMAGIEEMAVALEAKGNTAMARQLRELLTNAEIQGEDIPPAEVTP